MKLKVSLENVLKLNSIFNNKQWIQIDGHEQVFEDLCILLNNLSEEQTELIIDLTKRYKWISLNEYNSRLSNLLRTIHQSELANIKKIYLFPIIKPEDEDKHKSGNSVIYMIKGISKFIKQYDNISITELTKFEMLNEDNLTIRKDELFILFDDFVGSGETLKATLQEVFKNPTLVNNKIIVASLIIQQDAIDFLKITGIRHYSSDIGIKEITQWYTSPLLEEKIRIMKEIEKLISVNSNFSFGYEQSEALVTMIRTPDNTFPIFWNEHKKNGQKYRAPFQRY